VEENSLLGRKLCEQDSLLAEISELHRKQTMLHQLKKLSRSLSTYIEANPTSNINRQNPAKTIAS